MEGILSHLIAQARKLRSLVAIAVASASASEMDGAHGSTFSFEPPCHSTSRRSTTLIVMATRCG